MIDFEDLRKTNLFYVGRLRHPDGWKEPKGYAVETVTSAELILAPTCKFETTLSLSREEIAKTATFTHMTHNSSCCPYLYLLLDSRVPEVFRKIIVDQWLGSLKVIDKIPFKTRSFMLIQPANAYIKSHVHPAGTKTTVTIAFRYPTLNTDDHTTNLCLGDPKHTTIPLTHDIMAFSIKGNPPHSVENKNSWIFYWVFDFEEDFDFKEYISNDDIPGMVLI